MCVVPGCVSGAQILLSTNRATNVNLTVTTEHLDGVDCDKGSGRPLPQPGLIGPRHKVSLNVVVPARPLAVVVV